MQHFPVGGDSYNLYSIYETLDRLTQYYSQSKEDPYKEDPYSALAVLRRELMLIITEYANEKFPYDPTLPFKKTLGARIAFDENRLTNIAKRLENFKEKLSQVIKEKQLSNITDLLNKLDEIIEKSKTSDYIEKKKKLIEERHENASLLAQLFAIEYIPFTQQNDPFLSAYNGGQCYGFTEDWAGNIASYGKTNINLLITPKILFEQRTQKNFLLGFAKNAVLKKQIENLFANSIWDVLDKINNDNLYLLNFAQHNTGIRAYGNGGIEFFEPNQGIFRFKSRYDFVNFMSIYLLILYQNMENPLKLNLIQLKGHNFRRDDNLEKKHHLTKEEIEECTKKLEEKIQTESDPKNTHPKTLSSAKRILRNNLADNNIDKEKNSPLKILKEQIIKEISRLKQNENPKIKGKAGRIQEALEKYSDYVNKRDDLNAIQKTSLLFVLMENSLAIKTGFFASLSYSNVQEIVNEIQLDRPLIQQFRQELKKYNSNENSFPPDAFQLQTEKPLNPEDLPYKPK